MVPETKEGRSSSDEDLDGSAPLRQGRLEKSEQILEPHKINSFELGCRLQEASR